MQVNDQIRDKKRCRNIQMIHYRLMPNSHLFALIAKLRWESPFITGYHHVKYFAQVVMVPYRQFLSSAANEDVYNGCRSLRMLIKKGENILFLPEQRIRSLELNTPGLLPKSLENIIYGFSEDIISYHHSNPGFLILFAFDCFSFTVNLEVVFRRTNSGNFTTA